MVLTQEVYFLLSAITAVIIVSFSIPSIIKVAKAKNLYDYPDHRKSHAVTVPTLGGLAIFAGLIVPVLLWTDFQYSKEIKFVLAAIIIIFFIGLKDDILVIAPKKKLFIQVLAAMIMVILGDIRITNLHGFAGISEIPYVVSIILSLFVIIVVLNGMNLIDGIDGLASGVGIVAALTFGIFFYVIGQFQYVIFVAALMGALGAFFFYNVFGKDNKIFMGDTGSLILGLVLAVMAIKFNEFSIMADGKYQLLSSPAVSIGILIIPLFDTIRVFVIRIFNKKSPFAADNNHVHHRLLQIGLSHIQATGVIVGVNMFFIAISFLLDGIGVISLLGILLILASMFSSIPMFILAYKNSKFDRMPTFAQMARNTSHLLLEDKSDFYFRKPTSKKVSPVEADESEIESETVKVY